MTAATSPVIVRFHALDTGLPKHARLRAAIVDAVKAGELPVGTKMAGERELSQSLGLSLGTMQKALGRLVDEGFLVRRQGHGTFVGSVRRPVSGSWHYCFLADDGVTDLPVFATIVERRLVGANGPWAAALGPDPKGFVMLHRHLDIGAKFACSSRMYLPAGRFGRLLRIAEKRLTDTNVKTVLADEFSAPTLSAEGVAHVTPVDIEDARVMRVATGTCTLQLDIVGRSFGRVAITFQRMVVPPVTHGLRLNFNPPASPSGPL